MRIALVSTSGAPTPPPRYGGIERVVHQLAEELTRAAHDVTVYAAPGSKGGRYALVEKREWYPPLDELRGYDALGLHQAGWPGRDGGVGTELRMLRAILRYARAMPTVYTFHHGLPYWVRPLRAAAMWPRRLVCTTPSPTEAAYAKRHGLARVVHVPNPVEDGTYRDAPAKSDALCFVASLTRRKAPEFAIEVARAAGRPIVLAGPKPDPAFFAEAVEPALRAYTQAEYRGEVTPEEKDDILSRSAALLHPTRGMEPFGLVVAEAIVRGTPCLSSDSGAPRHIVETTQGGAIVAPHDAQAWARALDEMLARPMDRRAMRERCLASYGIEGVARAYAQALRRARDG